MLPLPNSSDSNLHSIQGIPTCQAVEWTKPDDLKYEEKTPAAGLGKLRPGGWLAAFVDGHVTVVANTVDKQVVNALFTRAGREIVNNPPPPP